MPEELQVVEPACYVCIDCQEPLTICIEYRMMHRTALAQVVLQSHYADIIYWTSPQGWKTWQR